MRLLLCAAVVVCAYAFDRDTQSVKSVKGGHGGFQYQGGDISRFYNSHNNTFQQGSFHNNSGPGVRPDFEVGVCYIEVPTSSLVRDKVIVPRGNGSRDGLSRIRTCCKGYARNVYNFKICDPVCSQECTNALCTAPDTCTCFPDHVRNQAGVCVATCPIGCQNGRCDGGECLCKEGFRLDVEGRFCVPVCRNNCGGIGNCTAPNVCECNPGIQPTPDGSCTSSACGKCENGDCVSASECRCKLGYNKDNQGQCVPHCNQNCGPNGKCLAPNVCSNSPDSQRGPNNLLPSGHGPNSQSPYGPPAQGTNSQNPYGPGQGNNFYYNPNQGSNYPVPSYNQNSPQQNQSNPVNPHQGSNYPQPNQAHPNQGSSYPQQPNPTYPNQGSPYPQPSPYNPNQGPHYPQPNPYNPDQGSQNQHPIVLYTNPNQPNQGNPTHSQYPYNQNPTDITLPNQGNPQSPLNPNQQNQGPSYYPSVHVVNITSYPLYPGNQLGPNRTVYPSNQPGQQTNQQYPGNQPNPNNPGNNQFHFNHGPNQPNNYPTQQHRYYPYSQDPYSSQYPNDQTQDISLCSEPCVNAVCIDRNRCRCNPGYVTDETDPSGNRCRPNCPGGCPNGYCAAPHTCACDEGYMMMNYKDTSVKGRAVCIRRFRRSLQELVFLIPENDGQLITR